MRSKKEVRFKGVDDASDPTPKGFDEAIDGSKEADVEAREEVREAVQRVEARIDNLQHRTGGEHLVP